MRMKNNLRGDSCCNGSKTKQTRRWKIEETIHVSNLVCWSSANRYRCWSMSFEISLAGGQTSILKTKNNNNNSVQGAVFLREFQHRVARHMRRPNENLIVKN